MGIRSLWRGLRGGNAVIRPPARASGYQGAATTNRTKAWVSGSDDPNSLIFTDADILRRRSRDTVRNNPWATNAIESFVANAVGTGIVPRSQHADKAIRDLIHTAWKRWTVESDASGLMDLYGQQAMACRATVEGGECFARFRNRRPEDGLSVPLQLQLLEAEHLPLYEYAMSGQARGKNRIVQGIEFTPFGKRVAYHLYRNHPGKTFSGLDSDTTRVPAEDVLHMFKPLRPGQDRGVPWLAPVLVRMYELDQFTDATAVRQKVAAMFSFFVTRPNADEAGLPIPAESTDDQSALAKLEPGGGQVLLPGEAIEFTDPPSIGSYEEFLRNELRAIAAGLGITYEQLTGDLTKVNYSSIRQGVLEFRRRCVQFQHRVLVFQFCRPIFQRWLREAVISGALDLPGYADNPAPYEAVKWIPPGWDWVDPLKDINAAILAKDHGLTSRSRIITQRGDDIEEIDAENLADQERVGNLYAESSPAQQNRKAATATLLLEQEDQEHREDMIQ